jgi:hypothetical protein
LSCIDVSRRRTTTETEQRETGTLIGSDKVEGTAVYGADNQKIGSIERQGRDHEPGYATITQRDLTEWTRQHRPCGAASELHSL